MGTLWLVGMMGAGKSTIAPLIAQRLGIEWFDTDREVERVRGASAADLVASDESAFRMAEREVVALLAGREAVVACGGGVVMDAPTVETMRASGTVVLLDAGVGTLATRVGDGAGRPLLADGVEASLERIASSRRGRYRSAAHAVVDASGTPAEVAERVLETWATSS